MIINVLYNYKIKIQNIVYNSTFQESFYKLFNFDTFLKEYREINTFQNVYSCWKYNIKIIPSIQTFLPLIIYIFAFIFYLYIKIIFMGYNLLKYGI